MSAIVPPNWHRTTIVGEPPEHRQHRHKPGFHPVIHSSARLEAYVTVDAGTERATQIGKRSWLFKHVHVGHDCLIGDDVEIATHTVLAGFVEVGNGARVGLNVTVLPYRKIGAGARVGAGAVVTRDVPAGETWAGVPARKLP